MLLHYNICGILPQSLQDIRSLWGNNIGKEMTAAQSMCIIWIHT